MGYACAEVKRLRESGREIKKEEIMRDRDVQRQERRKEIK